MNIFKNTIIRVLLAILTIHVGYAGDPSAEKELSLTLNPLEERSIAVLSVRNLVDNKAELTIFNSNRELIFRKTFSESPVLLEKFNFSRLEQGAYTMKVVSKNQSVSQSFEIDYLGNVKVQEDVVTELLSPYVVKKDRELFVRFNNHAAEEILVKIYDQENNLIYQEFENSLKVFGRRYSFAQIDGETYRLEIKAGGKEFEREIKL